MTAAPESRDTAEITLDEHTTPVEIRAPKGGRVLEVDWADGTTTRHRHLHLRAFCPCAHCQGHQGPIRWTEVSDDERTLELLTIDEVGSYAIQLGWGDGHRTGIYSFPYLRELAELTPLSEAEARTRLFGRS